MRMLDDDTNSQVFDACLLLTQEEADEFVGYLRFVLGMHEDEKNYEDPLIPGAYFATSDPGPNSHSHICCFCGGEPRGIMPLHYEVVTAKQDGWHPRTVRLIEDAAGLLEDLGPEMQ